VGNVLFVIHLPARQQKLNNKTSCNIDKLSGMRSLLYVILQYSSKAGRIGGAVAKNEFVLYSTVLVLYSSTYIVQVDPRSFGIKSSATTTTTKNRTTPYKLYKQQALSCAVLFSLV
jgi:hypothetical protein